MNRDRAGITLVETLVVLSVIGVLVSLLLMGIQSARESARRASCQNHLRQIGIAINNFSASSKAFPSLVGNRGTKGDAMADQSAFVAILPELEVYLSEHPSRRPENENPDSPPAVLRCPSSNEYLGYRYNYGTHVRLMGPLNGILRHFQGLSHAEITDGLSQTALISERMGGKQLAWPYGIAMIPRYMSDESFARGCNNVPRSNSRAHDTGIKWHGYHIADLTYNHYWQPNHRSWDCQGFMNQVISARSHHSAGVNVLFADGHISFCSSSIDLVIWRALGTVAGNETIDQVP